LHHLIRRDPDAADELVVELRAHLAAAVDDIRRVAYDLRPPALDEFGLVGAIRLRASQFNTRSGDLPPGSQIQVIVRAPEPFPAVPAAVEVATYRIVLEALTNVVRHAQATRCEIDLAVQNAWLQMTIRDDGKGFDGHPSPGMGIEVMKERAAELGGRHTVEPVAGGGTLVRVSLPLPRE
jgi:signal transduction histidine kinase